MKDFYPIVSEPTEITENREMEGSAVVAAPLCLPRRSDAKAGRGVGAVGLTAKTPRSGSCRTAATPGWILYDGQCRYCLAAARQFERLFARRGFYFLPLQTPWVQKRLGLQPDAPLEEMRVLTRDNQDLGGADAVIFLVGKIWWLWSLSILGQLPFVHAIIDRAYRWIAAHRGCTHFSGRDALCGVPKISGTRRSSSLRSRITRWVGLLILPPLVLVARTHVAPWVFMWLMAGALFFGCKWLTFWRTRQHVDSSIGRSLGYLLAWPGMDATNFLGPGSCANPPNCNSGFQNLGRVVRDSTRVACAPILKIAFGVLLLFIAARTAPNPLLAGWIGMIGMILIFHFGLFDLAAIAWRVAGVDARPVMNSPIKATSLSEFWGRRWNGAFNQLVLDVLFRPLTRWLGGRSSSPSRRLSGAGGRDARIRSRRSSTLHFQRATGRATLTAFFLSGLVHELVISLPAGGGYGLPTAYFLLQGWGVVAQRTLVGKRFNLERGVRGRIFTMLIAAGPAFWLFHPPFVRNVVLPFMKAIGAL
jgi:predicted DCC family thiol-disulfide oxidoreductase YuxK